jgi:hypothetical protein
MGGIRRLFFQQMEFDCLHTLAAMVVGLTGRFLLAGVVTAGRGRSWYSRRASAVAKDGKADAECQQQR